MVQFGLTLQREARDDWRLAYINYEVLKVHIEEIAASKEAGGDQATLDLLKRKFQLALDGEILKVIKFFQWRVIELQQATGGALERGRALLLSDGRRIPDEQRHAAALEALLGKVQRLLAEATGLLQFVSLNMTAVRKILKKMAKHVEPSAPVPGFLTLEVEHPDDPRWRVLQGTLLPDDVSAELSAFQQHAELTRASERLQSLFASVREYRRRRLAPAAGRGVRFDDAVLGAVESALGGVAAAEAEAARNAALVHPVSWVERAAGMFEPAPPDAYAVATRAGLLANNLSALLFLMNYTAVLPTMGSLCGRLGISQAWTGQIMAASDAAAALSAVAISYWTNSSFKAPLLFCAGACIAGNAVYCMSYRYRSLGLLLLARALNGLGSARTANRRYTADYVSKAHRTAASAAFVAASNLGQALGPFLALPLSHLGPADTREPDGTGGAPWSNPVTAVGVVMALLWAAFFVGTAVWFSDPPQRSQPIGRSPSPEEEPLLLGEGEDWADEAAEPGALDGEGRQPKAGVQAGPAAEEPGLDAAGSGGNGAFSVGGTGGLGGATRTPGATPPASPARLRPGAGSAAGAAWRATVRGTLACALCLFVQKAAQQAYYDSVPILTGRLYGWGSAHVGLFLGLVVLAMLPIEALVGYASSALVSDRRMLLCAAALSAAALAAMAGSARSGVAFFGGGVAMFVGTVVLEVGATSLMSKVIWPGFARGTLNAGLLSTEAGTLGRFTGNAALALVGWATGVGKLRTLGVFAAWLYGGMALACGGLLCLLGSWYRHLADR